MPYCFSTFFLEKSSKIALCLFLLALVAFPTFSWASSPLDTTLVIEKDIYPKITNKQERLIEGKKYTFATINGRKGMVALSGNFLSEMARAAGIEVGDFLDWNDMKPTDAIKTGQVYYLEDKGKRAEDVATHVLLQDETLWDVSQKYAMQYKYLLKYNRLDEDDKVKVGRVLWIQTKRPKKVPVEVRDVTPIVANFEEDDTETAADPELMAEWEELKKTELAGIDDNKEDKTTSTTTITKDETKKTDSDDAPQQGSFEEFESETDKEGVVITEKTDDKKEEKTASNVVKYHTVAEAESLYDVSKKYNVVMSKLKEWNNLADYTVYTGQKLIVSQPDLSNEDKVYNGSLVTEKPEKNNTSSEKKVVVKQNTDGNFVTFIDSSGVLLPTPQEDFRPVQPTILDIKNADYHIVEKDETLWSIARKYNLSPKKLILWNGFVTGDNIDVGDKIVLKESLALPEGSRKEVEQNSGSSSTNNTNTEGNTQFKDPTLIDPAISNGVADSDNSSQSKTDASTLSREDIIQAGGNPDNVGKEGYDEIGVPIAGYDFSNNKGNKVDTMKTKVVETETKAEIYVVKPQDVLGRIAQKYSTTTKELLEWNPKLPKTGAIRVGDTLFVSPPKTTQTVTEETSTQQTATVYPVEYYGAGFHAVQPNENIYTLGDKYGIPIARLIEWNNLDKNTIDLPVGMKMIVNEGVLKMGSGGSTAQNSETQQTETVQMSYVHHVVEKGETLFSIARKYNLSTAQVREWNNRQGDLVYEGEKLIVGIK
ncbi:muramidase family protein [Bernardetia sp.]|uniref:muramidase family protein n=1 Tax=Bernardetia sp. TaxID=1937974 RepID=UPI0025BCBD2A|nr:LysM peptidoglycan-binding domain-containing protein [Bernardetia sp.]